MRRNGRRRFLFEGAGSCRFVHPDGQSAGAHAVRL
jgi:hypothetical protein